MPTFKRIPDPQVDVVRQAIAVPTLTGRSMPHGVFTAEGEICPNSRTMMGGPRWSSVPDCPDPATLGLLSGRHLFGGVGRVHFGHFLIEAIPRLWALDHLDAPVDSVLFFPMHNRTADKMFSKPLRELIAMFCGDIPITPLPAPMRIEELLVPSQGVGHLNWSVGTPEFRQFARARFEARYKPNGPEKLYISRTKIRNQTGLVDQEDAVEDLMAEAGYTVFHPEQYPIRTQIEYLMAARTVVGMDGSAFHLAAHVLQPGARVGLIMRRHRPQVFAAIASQIKAFSDVDLKTLHPLHPEEETGEKPRLNLHRLRHALRRKGFI